MHYLIETTGPLSQQAITDAVMTYMNYPGYLRPAAKTVTRMGPPAPTLGRRGPGNPAGGAFRSRPFPDFSAASSSLAMATRRASGTPMVLQLGNLIEVAPGIRLQQMSNLGRTYQDLFFWSATGRTHVLGVSGRGAHHDWQTLPDGWDNLRFANAHPAHLGDLRAGQALQKAVSQMTLAEKLGAAMWQAKDYVGPEAKDLIDQLTTPEAIGQLVMIEIVYGISLFFGVGEVVTGLIIIAGVIFVGEVVIDILESLVAFVTTAKDATTPAQLTLAAKHFAHALTLGLAIVAALLLRKAVRRLPIQTSMTPRPGMTIVRRGGSGGGGKRKLLAAEVKPPEPVKPVETKPVETPGGKMGKRAAEKGFDGIETTPNGGPTFKNSEYLYKPKLGEKNVVQIEMKGGRSADFKAANEAAGLPGSKPPKGYTWHHVDDYNPKTGTCTMELVKTEAHVATFPHKGSVYQYEKATGKVYK